MRDELRLGARNQIQVGAGGAYLGERVRGAIHLWHLRLVAIQARLSLQGRRLQFDLWILLDERQNGMKVNVTESSYSIRTHPSNPFQRKFQLPLPQMKAPCCSFIAPRQYQEHKLISPTTLAQGILLSLPVRIQTCAFPVSIQPANQHAVLVKTECT